MQHTKFSVTLVTFLSGFSGVTAYAVILGVLLVCGLGVPIPEDITLISAGILAALGSISYFGAMVAGFIGVLLGDCILFFIGRKFGYRVFQLRLFKKLFSEKQLQMARVRILNNSKLICFSARFLPGLRAPIYLTAGIMGVSPLVFFILDGFAALISVPIWIHVGWYFGSNIDYAIAIAVRAQKFIFGTAVVLILLYVAWRVHKRKKEAALLAQAEPIPLPTDDKI